MLKNRKILFFILIIVCYLDACQTPKHPLARYDGTYSKGIYRSPNKDFIAIIPYHESITRITDKQLPGKFIVDIYVTPSHLTHSTRRGIYRYSIEWFDSKSIFSSQKSLNKYVIENVSKFISNELDKSAKLEFFQGENIFIRDEITGYMFIGSGNHKKIRENARSIYGIYLTFGEKSAILYATLKRKIDKVDNINDLPDIKKFISFYESFYAS